MGSLASHNWFPDTGATNHATLDIYALSMYEEYTGDDTLCVSNGTGLPISSVGHASFATPSRSFRKSNVFHVHGLSASLLSMQCFGSDNHVFFEFHTSFFVVENLTTKGVLLRGRSSGGLYSLPLARSSPSTSVSAHASASV